MVLTKDERTGKTGYNTVVELFKRQADETYQITAKGITITTTEEHPFWVPGRGWIEARHLKAGDLLQNPEGKPYPIDRIEIKKNSTTVYNFRVEGVHNYFVTELEIWTHNCGAGGMRNIPMRAPSGGGSSQASKGTGSTYRLSDNHNIPKKITNEYDNIQLGKGTPRIDKDGNQKIFSANELKNKTGQKNVWEGSKEWDVPGSKHRILEQPNGKLGYVTNHDYSKPKLFPSPWFPDGGVK
ncbi:HINT domain-containing protein [Paenibacillus melissococcoides]|uniref:HINT domain-containing protein n=2 Tax=Paenibacillus melissococcoides TaxID=2912268 RepID=A0ABM9G7B5_9BACL|nr:MULTISPECIES: polymorphic toxin-type HINT domain-containing protein [Paenibacillus]CAH8247766.1 HINT domain-containing protein [Paenibacillus melissococcoides]CAH8719604.1 HINT domain-containing protein [Paenibacillus melissococcoides]CAH8720601.1 HINT domain-containing protein [Paenibacillus melissococcoides]